MNVITPELQSGIGEVSVCFRRRPASRQQVLLEFSIFADAPGVYKNNASAARIIDRVTTVPIEMVARFLRQARATLRSIGTLLDLDVGQRCRRTSAYRTEILSNEIAPESRTAFQDCHTCYGAGYWGNLQSLWRDSPVGPHAGNWIRATPLLGNGIAAMPLFGTERTSPTDRSGSGTGVSVPRSTTFVHMGCSPGAWRFDSCAPIAYNTERKSSTKRVSLMVPPFERCGLK